MHRVSSWIAAGAAVLLMVGCGGGSSPSTLSGSSSTSGGSGGTTTPPPAPVPSSITVSSSAQSIPADGSSTSTITVLAKDGNNNAMSGVTLVLAASAGTLVAASNVTNSSGVVTATLSASGVSAGTSITVNASSGGVSGKTTVGVVATQQNVTLLTSSPQLASDNSQPVTITAIVRGANNQLLSGVPVSFTSTSGAIIAVQTPSKSAPAGTTDANGEAQATLTTPGDPSNRAITVTASLTGSASQSTVSVNVVGTKLTVSGPASLIIGSAGTFNVGLVDAGGNGIAGQSVTLTSSQGNKLNPTTVTTDATGHATFSVTGAVAGNDTIGAAALGQSASAALAVSSQNFAFTSPAANSTVAISTPQTVAVLWENGSSPVVGQTVTFSTTRGTFSGGGTTATATTDGTGAAQATVTSATAGPAVVTATGSGVSTQLNLTFIATTPASVAAQASPATIPTSGQSTITAIVRDANNNLVEGATVDFQLTDKTGGSISVGSALTDVQGKAQTVYTATTTASAANGVQIAASVQGTALTPATVTLTVGGQTLFLSLGTGNTISENATQTQFIVPYVVQALDSAGNAVPGVTITFTVHSIPPTVANGGSPAYSTDFTHGGYAKGSWFPTGATPAWAQGNGSLATPPVYCLNEDVNGNGIFSPAEDLNTNGILDPGDVAAVSPGSLTTDSTGAGNITVTYPEDHALWVQVRLTATATVNGTQSSTSSTFWLPMLAAKIASSTVSPPGVHSPYGDSNSCANPN